MNRFAFGFWYLNIFYTITLSKLPIIKIVLLSLRADIEGLEGTWEYLGVPGHTQEMLRRISSTCEWLKISPEYTKVPDICVIFPPGTLRYAQVPSRPSKLPIREKGNSYNNRLTCFFEKCFCIKDAQIPKSKYKTVQKIIGIRSAGHKIHDL